MDGRSASFKTNYGRCTKRCATDRPPATGSLPIQYADFAAWQDEWLQFAGGRPSICNYWLKQLEGPLKILDFPTDHPPALRISSNGGIEFLIRAGGSDAGL